MADRPLSVGMNLRKVNSKDFDYKKMETLIEKAYLDGNRGVSHKRKVSFAPSSIGYGHGTCFSGETEFVTDQGIRTMADAVGEEVVVWTGHGRWGQGRDKSWSTSRGWKAATVESFGVHPLMKITAERNGVTREIYATESHRWIVETSKHPRDEKRGCAVRKTTSELEPGWRLWRDARVPSTAAISNDGVRAGLVYGDGSKSDTWSMRKQGATLTLHGDKDLQLLHLFSDYPVSDEFIKSGEDTEFIKNNHVKARRVSNLPRSYKDRPNVSESHSYLRGWLAGYFAADGNIHPSGSASITSHDRFAIEAVRDVCAILGVNAGTIVTADREKLGKIYTEHSISMNFRDLGEDFFLLSHHRDYYLEMVDRNFTLNSPRWKVVSVEKTDRVEEVFCVVEPETERFALADGILTMNCPRRWYLSFAGAEFDESSDAVGIATMANGTATHDRLQELFKSAGIAIEIEKEMKVLNPPIRAFIDVIADVDGIKAVIEIKSTRDESFVHRRYSAKPMAYHLYQLLLYMYFEGIDQGAIMYENKNDNTILTLPVRMNDYTRKVIEDAIEWMTMVWENWKQDATFEPVEDANPLDVKKDGYVETSYENLPARPFTKKSKECKQCPLWNECWVTRPEGNVKMLPMEVVKL